MCYAVAFVLCHVLCVMCLLVCYLGVHHPSEDAAAAAVQAIHDHLHLAVQQPQLREMPCLR